MTSIREKRQALERQTLSKSASLSEDSRGREKPEDGCKIRTCYQRDIDRIIHCKAFRRLKHKTQVFIQPEGDHYRTRLTHTLEVARIARTISRALCLNEDLTEAIALGHDLGHTPFGHAGERALNELLINEGGFKHNEQSLRTVEKLERDGEGLNLTYEVRDGILNHTGAVDPVTHEGKVVKISDRIAYLNHDVDDAIRAGILRQTDIPEEIVCVLGSEHGERINNLISNIVDGSEKCGDIALDAQSALAFHSFRDFMYSSVYINKRAKSEESKVLGVLSGIFEHYMKNPDEMTLDYRKIIAKEGVKQAVCDYIAGMTDKYAIYTYGDLFVPAAWKVR